MKSKNTKIITTALTSAVCTLLGPAQSHAEGAGWKIDTAYLSYSEKDRVKASEPTLKLQKTFIDDSKLNINIVYDTISGPSPNGAAPSNQPQTFSGPSGGTSTLVNAGEIPMDNNFQDTRKQFGTSWDSMINRLMRYNLGFNTSAEHDYKSIGVSAGLSRDFNKKNTTLATGIALTHDTITPEGGAPEPTKAMLADQYNTLTGASGNAGSSSCNTITGASGICNTVTGASGGTTGEAGETESEGAGDVGEIEDYHPNNILNINPYNEAEPGEDIIEGKEIAASKNKDTVDFFVGLTQVINPQTIMQFTLGLNKATGYLNDPYKVVSIVDGTTGVPLTIADGGIIYESRPTSRLKTSLYWDTKYHLDRGDTVGISYRFMFDDWGVKSHTVDVSYRWNMTDYLYVQPHVRLYTQNAADFYRQSLGSNEPVPQEVSADSRLAAFNATTAGAKIGLKITEQSEFNIRFEQYQQLGQKLDNAIGIQANYDTFPALDATIIQIGYSIAF